MYNINVIGMSFQINKENSFNCCENVLMKINKKHPLTGINNDTLAIASNFARGVAYEGEICGCILGASIAIGLALGTRGNEETQKYKQKRATLKEATQKMVNSFRNEWGNLRCIDLLGVDFTKVFGLDVFNYITEKGYKLCKEYEDWSVEKTLEILAEIEHK